MTQTLTIILLPLLPGAPSKRRRSRAHALCVFAEVHVHSVTPQVRYNYSAPDRRCALPSALRAAHSRGTGASRGPPHRVARRGAARETAAGARRRRVRCERQTMRVAICHPDLGLGGAERLIVDAASALAARGHDVVVRDAPRKACTARGGAAGAGRQRQRRCRCSRRFRPLAAAPCARRGSRWPVARPLPSCGLDGVREPLRSRKRVRLNAERGPAPCSQFCGLRVPAAG